MSRLLTEHQRLFAPTESGVRFMALGLKGGHAWARLSPLWTAVQAEAQWPAPLIAVNGVDGCGLWFALASPVPTAEAAALLHTWRQRFLNDVQPHDVWAWPDAEATHSQPPRLPPYVAGEVEGETRWAAFVAPDLAAVFSDAPWLDLPPGDEAQAELLSRHRAVTAEAWVRGCARWLPAARAEANAPAASPSATVATHPLVPTGAAIGGYDDPRAFLRAVMNDPQIPIAQRIDAAKALLRG